MKPPPFAYHAPRDLDAALDALREAGAHGKVLAGGQSLIPLMNMRLAAPEHLIDINRLAGLDTIEADGDGVRIGALARHSRVERSGPAPLRRALKLVAHPVIRNRGTVVGSLVHADPAAELPAVLAVLGGSVRLARRPPAGSAMGRGDAGPGVGGGSMTGLGSSAGSGSVVTRDVVAADFFVGPLESDTRPGELAISAYFPNLPPRSGFAIHELARRHGDYALAGVCAVVTLDGDRIATARAACIGVAAVPLVLDVTGAGDTPAELARAVREQTEPEADIHASADYRRHLVGVLAERAFADAAREAAQ